MHDDVLNIGIDAGGSKTELLARKASREDLTLYGPPANLQRLGIEETGRVLANLVRSAREERPEAQDICLCAGLAGAGNPDDREALARHLRERLESFSIPYLHIVHDAEIALEGAFEGESGVIVIAGTGSVVFGRATDGTLERAGGWGYLIGDEGSGHALGAHGFRAVTADIDGGPSTRLRPMLAEAYGLTTRDEIIHAVYRKDWPLQQMAPLVTKAAAAGDAPAQRILQEQTRLLVRQVCWLCERLPSITPQIALLGGLMNEAPYRKAFEQRLSEYLPQWTVRVPKHRPVVGALRLALSEKGV